jgi:hypothetical protein
MTIIIILCVLAIVGALALNIADERREEARYAAKLELYKDKAERRSYYPKGVVIHAYRKGV